MADKGIPGRSRGRTRGRRGGDTDRVTPPAPDPETIAQLQEENSALPQSQSTPDQFADVPIDSTPKDSPKTTIGDGKTPPLVKDLKEIVQQGTKVGNSSTLNPRSPEFAPSSSTLSAKAVPFTLSNGPPTGLDSTRQTSVESPSLPLITKQAPTSTFSLTGPRHTQPLSKLNISAPEFVPGAPLPVQVQNGVDESFTEVPRIPEEEIPSFGPIDLIRGFTPVVPLEVLETEPLLKTVSEVLVKGAVYVGSFDRLETKLQTTVTTFPPSEDVLSNLAEMLVFWGVSEPYFRYTACKMCEVLCNEVQDFRTQLIQRLMEWYKRETTSSKESAEEKCSFISFSLFFSELFTRLRVGDQPIVIFAGKIFEAVDTLLKLKTDDTVIGACNILKLTGALLEQCGERSPGKMTQVIEMLKKLCIDETLSRSCTDVLVRVIQQSSHKWGETVITGAHPPLGPPPAQEEKGKLNIDAVPFVPSGDFVFQQPVSNVEEWNEFETDYGDAFEGVLYDHPDGDPDDDGLDPDIELEMEAFIDEIEEHLLMQDFDPDEQFSND